MLLPSILVTELCFRLAVAVRVHLPQVNISALDAVKSAVVMEEEEEEEDIEVKIATALNVHTTLANMTLATQVATTVVGATKNAGMTAMVDVADTRIAAGTMTLAVDVTTKLVAGATMTDVVQEGMRTHPVVDATRTAGTRIVAEQLSFV